MKLATTTGDFSAYTVSQKESITSERRASNTPTIISEQTIQEERAYTAQTGKNIFGI